MEKLSHNSPTPDFNPEHTIVISKPDPADAIRASDEAILESLPQKPQDRYKFIRSIGFGGMKGVLLVSDRDTGREVAMAIMPDFRSRPKSDLIRFVREAKITAKLEHPNIVPVHDIGIDNSGSPFFTMKYLRGSTLAVLLRKLKNGDEETLARYTQPKLLQIFMRICNAVAFAHSQGICHLDLKPGNIHCGDFGEVQVLDWGLAAASDDDFDKGKLNGTPGFMAPEFIRSGGSIRPGKAADIYALGAILYSILTYNTPFSGLPQNEILRRTANGSRIKLPSSIPPSLAAICYKAMDNDPEKRYSSARSMKLEITAILNGFPSNAENATLLRSSLLFFIRNWMLIIIILLAAATVISSYAAYYFSILSKGAN